MIYFQHSEENNEYHYCYYPIPLTEELIQVKLKKSSNCTAFKTWEACFAFLEWVVNHTSLFRSKRILEVGSGSGLCGQMMQCIVRDCQIVMSDYCDEVTEYIRRNIEDSRWNWKYFHTDRSTSIRMPSYRNSIC